MFNSLLLAGLVGFAATVVGHPHPSAASSGGKGSLSRRLDFSQFRMPDLGRYVMAQIIQSDAQMARIVPAGHYLDTAKALVKIVAPDAEYRIVDDHYIGADRIAHVYLKQTLHGIDVDNGDFNVNVDRNGRVFSYGGSFFDNNSTENPFTTRRSSYSSPSAALNAVITTLNLPISARNARAQPKKDKETYILTGTTGAVSDPTAKLVYLGTKDGKIKLTWRVETNIGYNWLLTYADAYSPSTIHGVVDYVSEAAATFQVYPWSTPDPTDGDRSVISDPWHLAASPYTWLSDGTNNYTTTRGNNAIASDNPSGEDEYENNYRPQSPTNTHEYPYDVTMTDPKAYRDAAITQLFYTANKFHDLLYVLGFDEKAGNFQKANAGKGGKEGDFVVLFAQDGMGMDNALFSTPPDGQPGVMRMFLWDLTTPYRDGCFASDIVLHEYTHGLSIRLTGGPSNSGCLDGLESGGMGEGWSDFMAVASHLKPSQDRTLDYGLTPWVLNNTIGIRKYPYSTNMTTNPLLWSNVNGNERVHEIGTIWCTILYEMIWNLIDKHGITAADIPEFDLRGAPEDGRYLAMKLVMGGMALQPCNPTLINARDALLDADKALMAGDNACEIWRAFAKRGLGEKAVQSETNRVDDFTVPAACTA